MPGWVEQLRCERADQHLDLLCQLAFLGAQLLDATSERAQGEQRSLELGVAAAVRATGREPSEQACAAEWAQLAAERLGAGDEQVRQLAEGGSFRVHGPVTGGQQRPQRLAFSAAARRRGPLLLEHAASGPDRVEGIALAAPAALPPQPADLEHPLAVLGPEAGQAGPERAGPLRSRTHAVPAPAQRRPAALPRSRRCRQPRSTRQPLLRFAPQRRRARARHGADRHQRRSPARLQTSLTTSSPGWRTTPVPAWGSRPLTAAP